MYENIFWNIAHAVEMRETDLYQLDDDAPSDFL